MNEPYHAILLLGKEFDDSGRSIAGYRLRTAAKKYGFNVLVIDCASALSLEEFDKIINNVVSKETLAIGISTQWLNFSMAENRIKWNKVAYYAELKKRFPWVKIVAGGSGVLKMGGSWWIYDSSDWNVVGFADESFPRLLKLLAGHKDHGLKYFVNKNGKKTIDSNKFHQVLNPDDLETKFELDDGFLPYQPLPLEVSRGCIFRCSFCSHPFQGAKDYDSYMRTPESLARELRNNYELFGTTRYTIMDDTFNDSVEKLDRLEKAIELAKLPNFEFQSYIRAEMLVTKPQMIDQLIRLGLKGGYVGLESMNHTARKAIGKGMDVNKVLDSLMTLNQRGKDVRLAGSMIIGLPGDSRDDIWKFQEFFVKNQNDLFRWWNYQALGIFNYGLTEKSRAQSDETMSSIEKNPEAYGYKMTWKDISYSDWENEHFTYQGAKELMEELHVVNQKTLKAGGWWLATAWHVNESKENIDNKLLYDLGLVKKAYSTVAARAEIIKKKFM